MRHAVIRGDVTYRAGDGVLLPIPPGPVEIEVADDSVTFGWAESNGSACCTAIPRDDYERYLRKGQDRGGLARSSGNCWAAL